MSVTITDNEHTSITEPDTPLRVDRLHPTASSVEVDVPPLRVVITPIVLPSPAIVSPKVHFAPAPSEKMQPTYHNNKGIQWTHCCHTQRIAPGQPLSTSAAPHPRQTTQRTRVPLPSQRYDTQSKSKASTLIAAFTRDTDIPAYALLDNAINPDSGTIATYE
jgi:hypothetical protein